MAHDEGTWELLAQEDGKLGIVVQHHWTRFKMELTDFLRNPDIVSFLVDMPPACEPLLQPEDTIDTTDTDSRSCRIGYQHGIGPRIGRMGVIYCLGYYDRLYAVGPGAVTNLPVPCTYRSAVGRCECIGYRVYEDKTHPMLLLRQIGVDNGPHRLRPHLPCILHGVGFECVAMLHAL